MLQFIAMVDMDCDGPTTYVYRIDVPAGLEDKEAMLKAIELGQFRFRVSDPSEWFTVPENLHALIRQHMGWGSDKNYCSIEGNIFR